MGILSFVCPSTGREVSTGIDIDAGSFTSLPTRLTQITCPYCNDHTIRSLQSDRGLAQRDPQSEQQR